ncbi:MAG: alpha/beta hydrolase [Acutalibacter muris]|nr:alpha/beta hydrolase [Acutalibacter muris]
MKYRNIDPELKGIAKRTPYNRAVIGCANILLPIALALTRTPSGISARSIMVQGHKGPEFRTEIFEPFGAGKNLPCLVYVHGGAFSYKASPHHKKLACIYALQANCRVYFPDYHLAPRYPYPAAYNDIISLYRYLMAGGCEKLGLAGDSAGGALAASVCNNYRREGLKRPAAQMLIYPLTDMSMQTRSMKEFTDTPLWNSKSNRRMWGYYCGPGAEERRPASPIHMVLPENIPDTYIETAEYDCLRDEGLLYGEKLKGAGAVVEINETKGTFHGYDCAVKAKITARSLQKRIGFLKKHFNA